MKSGSVSNGLERKFVYLVKNNNIASRCQIRIMDDDISEILTKQSYPIDEISDDCFRLTPFFPDKLPETSDNRRV